MTFIGYFWTNKANLNIWKSEIDYQQESLIYQDNCSPYTTFPWWSECLPGSNFFSSSPFVFQKTFEISVLNAYIPWYPAEV